MPLYHVSYAGKLKREVRELYRFARTQGLKQLSRTSFLELLRGMRERPSDLGEPLYDLHALGLQVRFASKELLTVYFAVDESRYIVYFQRLVLTSP